MDENGTPTPLPGLSTRERARLGFAILVGAVFGISCMSFSIERNPSDAVSDLHPTLKQQGDFTVNTSPEGIQVYYPRPYISPPNLKLDAGLHTEDIVIVEQKPDHFVVRVKGFSSREVNWFAKGIPVTLPPPSVAAPPPGSVEIIPSASAIPSKDKSAPPPPEPIEIPATQPKGQ